MGQANTMTLYVNLAAIFFYVIAGLYAIKCFARQQPIHRTALFALIATALKEREDPSALAKVETRVRELAAQFPPYPDAFPGHV